MNDVEAEKPTPVPTATSAPFWRAASEGRLDMQFCPRCARYVHYPRPLCPGCLGRLDWRTLSGRGTVYSFTVVHRAPSREFADVPYTLALVDLEEGPRLLARVSDDPERVHFGADVVVQFERRGEFAVPVVALKVEA